jgi:hypothetical protein
MDRMPTRRGIRTSDIISYIHREYCSRIVNKKLFSNRCSDFGIEINNMKISNSELDTILKCSSIMFEIFEICKNDVEILQITFHSVCDIISALIHRKMHFHVNNISVFTFLVSTMAELDFVRARRSSFMISDIMLMLPIRYDVENFILANGMQSLLIFSQSTEIENGCENCRMPTYKNILIIISIVTEYYNNYDRITAEKIQLFVLHNRKTNMCLNDDVMKRINGILTENECVSQFSHIFVHIIKSKAYPDCCFHVNDMTFRMLRDRNMFESAGGSKLLIDEKLQMIRTTYNCENPAEYYHYADRRDYVGMTIYDIRNCLACLYKDDSDRQFCKDYMNSIDNTVDERDRLKQTAGKSIFLEFIMKYVNSFAKTI